MMKKNATWGGLRYEAPSAEIIEAVTEGVFCSSTFGIYDWEHESEDESLDFN